MLLLVRLEANIEREDDMRLRSIWMPRALWLLFVLVAVAGAPLSAGIMTAGPASEAAVPRFPGVDDGCVYAVQPYQPWVCVPQL